MRIRDRIMKDPRVSEISDERSLDCGIWVYLKRGYCDGELRYHSAAGCLHQIHEDTWTACLAKLNRVTPCPPSEDG